MDSLVESYTSFYDSLSPFLKTYPSHLQTAHRNSALKYSAAILDILPTDSSYISDGKLDEVKEGVNRTLEMTEIFLQEGARFLDQSSQDWFKVQNTVLFIQMRMVYVSLGCVVNQRNSNQVQEEASGIGGGNTSKKGGPSAETLEKVRNILLYLQQD